MQGHPGVYLHRSKMESYIAAVDSNHSKIRYALKCRMSIQFEILDRWSDMQGHPGLYLRSTKSQEWTQYHSKIKI